MVENLKLEIPDDLARQARALAAATNRRFEDAVVEWIGRAVAEPVVEFLSDEQLLALCASTMEATQQERMGELLFRLREGSLGSDELGRLEELMAIYRRGLILKAKALKAAVARGIKPRLADDAA